MVRLRVNLTPDLRANVAKMNQYVRSPHNNPRGHLRALPGIPALVQLVVHPLVGNRNLMISASIFQTEGHLLYMDPYRRQLRPQCLQCPPVISTSDHTVVTLLTPLLTSASKCL